MVDFLEYVVGELKSKRLPKADAVALVQQFSRRPSRGAKTSVLHPLLHSNTSDLSEQRYRSTFTGDEFFLVDHQVRAGDGASQKVLPGMAYLEMVRAAIALALPEHSSLELRNVVWAQPFVVNQPKEIVITLIANDGDEIDCEIASEEAEQEVVHCQARAILRGPPAPVRIDLDHLRSQMDLGPVEPATIYAAFARMGLLYGPAFQGLTAIDRGTDQALARIRLPQSLEETAAAFVLHPSMLDSALQASAGLIGDLSDLSDKARLPFALESLRILSPCTREMVVWVRYAPGSRADDPVVKLDVDLCDERGNVCVQLHGVSTRALSPVQFHAPIRSAVQNVIAPVMALEHDSATLAEKTEDYFRRQFSGLLKVPSSEIDPRAPLEKYGIDSILAMKLTNQLEKTFGSLSKTLFFEYQTVRDLAEYFLANHAEQLAALFATPVSRPAVATPVAAEVMGPAPAKGSARRHFRRSRSGSPGPMTETEPIAIIGLSGRYPEAVNIEAYWHNLQDGKDCIVEVPKDRWDWRDYYTEDRKKSGHHYSKWGGFIEGVDEFDPLFFNISPLEAEIMDPQERLFLQHVWMAIEDAGYTRASLQVPYEQDQAGQAGVYVGVMYNEYQLFGAESSLHGKRVGIAGSVASIANRVSYILDLHGPSMTLDTMCSSSLTAIHLACQDLNRGRTSLAIAGGVNVTIHPNKYLALSAGQFISGDGHCQSFGEGGDGYIPGEGVGVAVLKRLSDATRDGDHIYGIIRGSAINHGGKTNGYTVPNPQAQASVISRALAESGTDARHISYIEAHGTGTSLGDPIEIAALNKAFHRYTADAEFCSIGSAKSNIGHCESAAGIAGLTKVLLQMQHQQIAPSLHSAQLNPHIDFHASPFVVNQKLRPWEQPVIDGRTLPRIAGISSFGAGGSNAHMIVEEYPSPVSQSVSAGPFAILLSARTPEQLQQRAIDLLAFLRARIGTIDLAAMAYTLQAGRESMDERLAFVVTSVEQLAETLQAWVAGEREIEDAYQGQVKRNKGALSVFTTDADLQQTIGKWMAAKKFSKLLDLWVKGLELDWSKLYGEARPLRISLPTYPFAREHYWIEGAGDAQGKLNGAATAVLHPLLHSNTSDLSEQRYRSTFTGEELFLIDHQVNGARVLPGVAYLEMARAAIEQASPVPPESTILELRDVVWMQPIVVTQATEIGIALSPDGDDRIDFEIYSQDAEEEIVHCQGRAVWSSQPVPASLDLEQLERQMGNTLEPSDLYAACARMGLVYGPSFQGITAIRRGAGQVLARLRLPESAESTSAEYFLHPSLMDSALQAAVGLIDDLSELPREPRLPFALETLRILAPCPPAMAAWVRYSPGCQSTDPVIKLDLDLCDERGNVCVQMHGFASRASGKEIRKATAPVKATGSLLATPVWKACGEMSARAGNIEYAEHHVILFEQSMVDRETLCSLLPHSQCLVLHAEKQMNIAERYSDYALACFARIQTILQSKPQGNVLVQIVVADHEEQTLLAGLSGLLRTAAFENPKLFGQLLLVSPDVTTEEIARHLEAEKASAPDPVVRYRQDARHVLHWEALPANAEAPPIAFKDPGLYLITGGLGGLGVLFAREILDRTREARVVLTGRSAASAETQAIVAGLSTDDGRVSYRQLDLGNPDDVAQLIAAIQHEHGPLNGILHCAGMIADSFILKKTSANFADVLAPKVTGTFHLDQASRDVPLDFFVLFSSIAGAMGNPGQADYATANGFLDQFAAYRNRQAAAGQRHGRTRSINWPLWQDGGMEIDPAGRELMQRTTGMQPMLTATGLQAFHRSLALPYDQLVVMEGDLPQMKRVLLLTDAQPSAPLANELRAGVEIDSGRLAEKTQVWLRKQLADVMKLPAHKLDPEAPLEEYGIDSILAMKLTNELEKTFGALSKTLFFEYQTIAALAGYFATAHPAIVRETLGLLQGRPASNDTPAIEDARPAPVRRRSRNRFAASAAAAPQDIAIIGVAGRYPQAENLEAFWRNLQSGRDSITEVPAERWDHSRFFDPDPNKLGKSYSKWGGFIADVDKFDPLFFNISPREATLIDPQERLFLETAWQTIEDAGYTRASISGSRTGVYVGVMWGQYELFGVEALLSHDTAIPSSSHASIANRVSYFFDFHGPSMALDTMCSSSLTAIHLACEELRKGEIDAAIAGGVNLTIHPYKYLSLSQGRFAASDGRCRSFGAGGDGYVPGEGVGAVLLKPLDKALRDGDRIDAVIKSSAVNHGGKTNGYTVPNPNAQAELILEALRKAKIDPATLSYVETHGTGTTLGDPIEITGLVKAFGEGAGQKQYVPIGSVKSNIGHLESAAGIAAVTKVLLQIRHQQLAPSIHADPLNPNIDFANTPFYVQTELAEWKRPAAHPRRVGVSSFGAGGSNAHLILEEFVDTREPVSVPDALPFVLSARDPEALRRYAERLVRYLDDESNLSLADLAYTSQIGRTPMDARLVVIASSVADLRDKLNRWSASSELEDVFYGQVRKAELNAGNLIAGPAGTLFIESLLADHELEKLARLWILGVGVDWALLYRGGTPRKVTFPTYPFARERYWIEQPALAPRVIPVVPLALAPPAPPEEKARTYYVPEWTLQPLHVPPERPAGPILMLDLEDGLAAALTARAEDPIVLVKFGKALDEIGPNVFVIDPEREEQFGELLGILANRGQLPGVVLHHEARPCNLEVREQVAQQLDRGIYTLFYLCRALMKRQVTARIVSVATSPLGTAIGGFLKTLVLENPRFRAKVVEIQNGPAALIWDEACEPDWTAQEVRYGSDGKRYVRRLVSYAGVENKSAPLPLRQNGVYLITGGLGRLGLIFAEYLATNFQARLVLTGRSAPRPDVEETLRQLQGYGAEVLYLQADVARLDDAERVVREAKARFAKIDGVIHAAGVHRDAFILRKTKEEMEAVLASKVYGTINVDLATKDENLDLFVLFSSVAGVTGNFGQCDYAYGNRFLDAFAETRAQMRPGRTLSIDWPYWEAGGMALSSEDIALLEKQTGTSPLPTQDGIRYWEDFLRSNVLQGVALYGTPSRIAAGIAPRIETAQPQTPLLSQAIDPATLFARTEAYLKELVGEEIQLSPDRIGSSDRFESFGIDSVMVNHFNANLERDLGALPKTLLYEHETVHELATYLVREVREALMIRFGSTEASESAAIKADVVPGAFSEPVAIEAEVVPVAMPAREQQHDSADAIAIIGIHGHYPHSASLDDYWENLKNGRDLIDLVPSNRWSYEEFYDPDPAAAFEGRIYCKWGAFLDDVDKFDPRFFNIPAEEAKIIDPQERLFLQSVWAAIEDAGYTRESLRTRFSKARSADVGVFVGVTTNSYNLLTSDEDSRGNVIRASALPWSIANRVSYFFNFKGPSMPIDTACSSSLVAIHLACESLKRRECQVAIAGGVNLYLHPSKYQSLCQKRMLSTGGVCNSYGAGDDGFVPGEGVGTVVLKPLRKAIADHDRIYAVIRGSAYEHSGRSNGYSVPNPSSQAGLIGRTLAEAGVHPESISYVEGHGTGTQLGDSLEIAALTQAFRKQTAKQQFCSVGSVKANLGHSESAAGIAGLAKVILQLKHRQLAPSIHSDVVNPNIELEGSPFYLQHGLSPWETSPDHPRRALINSFGAGGVNACLIVEDYDEGVSASAIETAPAAGPFVFALSARNEERLREYADRLLVHLRSEENVDMANLCYTLQTGREAMEERLALVVSGVGDLIARLDDWSNHDPSNVYRGSLGPRRGSSKRSSAPAGDPNLNDLASAWVAGEDVDWTRLYPSNPPRRIALPTYPFARERFWISDSPMPAKRIVAEARLHPLISYNSSTLKEVSFTSSLSETAFYAVDHLVNDEPIFPGAGFLEMACVAGNIAGEHRVHKIKDVVWSYPLSFRAGAPVLRTQLKHAGDIAEYVISSIDDEGEAVPHSEGRLVFLNGWADAGHTEERVSIQELKAQCVRAEDGDSFYDKFRAYGLHYGPAFQTVQEIHIAGSFALAKLKIADHLKDDFGQFILHPSMIDGALQTAAGLVGGLEPATPYLPFALDEVEIIQPVTQICYALAEFAGSAEQNYAGFRKFNIRLLSESGELLVRLQNLFVKALVRPEGLLAPVAGWLPAERQAITRAEQP